MAARATRPVADDDPAAARVAALAESLSEVLSSATPLDDLVERVALVTRATVAVLDRAGDVRCGAGTLPHALVGRAVDAASTSPHAFAADGWSGLVHRVTGGDDDAAGPAWLVAVSRADGFPTSIDRAALAIGCSLVTAIGRAASATVRQDRAVRAGILERALELHLRADDPELSARFAELGIDFTDEVRVMVLTPARQRGRAARPIGEMGEDVHRRLRAAGIAELWTSRAEHAVVLARATAGELRRLCIAAGIDAQAHIGVGRRVTSVGAIVDSFHDAHLGARVAQQQGGGRGLVAYEDFDFATRLFADVGLDTMAAWAADYLSPLDGRGPVMVGLATYFATNQNVKAAARELGIHQNSMRYRLAKVEELLGVELSNPAAVASIHLALTAMELADPNGGTRRVPVPRRVPSVVHDADSPEAATEFGRPGAATFGAVTDPSP